MRIDRFLEIWHASGDEEPFWKRLLPQCAVGWILTWIAAALLYPAFASQILERLVITTIGSLAFFGTYLLGRQVFLDLGADRSLDREDAVRASLVPEPASWTSVLNASQLIRVLDPRQRQRLVRRMSDFLDQVRFEACGGAELDDRVKVLVASQASLMALNLAVGAFARIRTVLLYPSSYRASAFSWMPHAEAGEPDARLGESWTSGTVVLATDHLEPNPPGTSPSHNLIIHEFAHQLDGAGGRVTGMPSVASPLQAAQLRRVLGISFARHCRQVRDGRPSVLDPYGAENPAEFFAVATEAFFQQPERLEHQHPDLYLQLARYYRQDPAASLRHPPPEEPPGSARHGAARGTGARKESA
jgi:Mlc titration factor MtfA (ptsG expression regulator)